MKKFLFFFSFLFLFFNIKAQLEERKWVELIKLDTLFILDMKYATKDNFVKEIIYPCERCFLRREPAEALVKAQKVLTKYGLFFKFFDCYRPRNAQKRLWEIYPNPNYVTPPKKGSMHNRGLAVDLTLIDSNGRELDMGTEFDYFGEEAHHDYTKFNKKIVKNRRILKMVMERSGFQFIRTEWWHYYYPIKLVKYAQFANQFWDCN